MNWKRDVGISRAYANIKVGDDGKDARKGAVIRRCKRCKDSV